MDKLDVFFIVYWCCLFLHVFTAICVQGLSESLKSKQKIVPFWPFCSKFTNFGGSSFQSYVALGPILSRAADLLKVHNAFGSNGLGTCASLPRQRIVILKGNCKIGINMSSILIVWLFFEFSSWALPTWSLHLLDRPCTSAVQKLPLLSDSHNLTTGQSDCHIVFRVVRFLLVSLKLFYISVSFLGLFSHCESHTVCSWHILLNQWPSFTYLGVVGALLGTALARFAPLPTWNLPTSMCLRVFACSIRVSILDPLLVDNIYGQYQFIRGA